MNAVIDTPPASANAAALSDWLLRTTLALLRGALAGGASLDVLLARHPALHDSLDAAAARGLADLTLDDALDRLDARLDAAPDGPLQRLRRALGLDLDGLSCWVCAALADTDPRLAPLIDELHGHDGRPTRATLARAFGGMAAAAALQALGAAGALHEDARLLAVPRPLWDLACGLPPARDAFVHHAAQTLLALDHLVLPAALQERIAATGQEGIPRPAEPAAPRGGMSKVAEPHLLMSGTPRVWLLRGSPGSGRRTLAGALARAAGLGLVEAVDAAHARLLGAAAALLGAMPLASFDPAPGETLAWPLPAGAPGLLAARLPRHGALVVEGAACIGLELAAPDAAERRRHWQLALGRDAPDAELVALRLPRGTLHRIARRLGGAVADPLGAALATLEELGRPALEGIARVVPAAGPDEPLALNDAAREEFDALVARCRHRDRLALALPAAFGPAAGVRALFKGPSGTGKTLAARQLAAALRRPLYRVDLAAAVSKYIGETERNLERVFEAAESLDIVLLLDEGDALLAGRTGVSNATDRYANLETNYLLQRLEHYDGVLVVTTNAADRIDPAFARRIDVSIEFPLPDAPTRLALWLAHLGERHRIGDELLERVALRCALAGGQIRNAALHAMLLGLQRGGAPDGGDLCRALEREYRKAGQHCPSIEEGG